MKKLEQESMVAYKIKDWKFLISTVILFMIMFLSKTFYGHDKINDVEKTTTLSLFRLKMQGQPNYLEECVFYYQAGATNGFDSDYDAYKLFGPNPAPHISIDNDSLLMSINGIPPVSQTYSTHILATTHLTGSFTITAADVQGFPSGTCIYLKDIQTNTTVNLLLSAYAFYLSNTTSSSRFILTITYNTLPITSNLIQPTCHLLNGGKATVIGGSDGPWNYVWKDTLENIIKTSLGLTTSDSLNNLYSGGYKVEITSVNNACLRNEMSFNVNEIISPFISFTLPDTIITGIANHFTPNNLSSNCISYFWDFGDGVGVSTDFEPSYNYSVCGTYLTKLVGMSNTGCKDSAIKSVKIIDFSTDVINKSNEKVLLADLGSNQFKIKLPLNISNPIFVNLTSVGGKQSFSKVYSEYVENSIFIDVNHLNVGLYIMNVKTNEKQLLSTKIYVKQ